MSNIRFFHIKSLVWLLLLLGSNQMKVIADNESFIVPKLRLDKDTIDLCNSSTDAKAFTLTVTLDHPIVKTDSLFVIELSVAYEKKYVQLTTGLVMGTLFQQLSDVKERDDYANEQFNIRNIQG